jgi:hypothetical protein
MGLVLWNWQDIPVFCGVILELFSMVFGNFCAHDDRDLLILGKYASTLTLRCSLNICQ